MSPWAFEWYHVHSHRSPVGTGNIQESPVPLEAELRWELCHGHGGLDGKILKKMQWGPQIHSVFGNIQKFIAEVSYFCFTPLVLQFCPKDPTPFRPGSHRVQSWWNVTVHDGHIMRPSSASFVERLDVGWEGVNAPQVPIIYLFKGHHRSFAQQVLYSSSCLSYAMCGTPVQQSADILRRSVCKNHSLIGDTL